MRPDTLLAHLRTRTPAMVEALAALVAVESPSTDPSDCGPCADVLAGIGERALGAAPERLEVDGRSHLRWRFGDAPRVLILGHFDTVWPLGTIDRWPFEIDGDRATGPGSFDMKGGLVQGLEALRALGELGELGELGGVELLYTSDEEVGSPTSRGFIEASAREAVAALVLEPAIDGALKTGRKGVSTYVLEIAGRAAHAGLEPEKGINALVELAHQALAIAALNTPAIGTTVTPTVASAGTMVNVVPAAARLEVDVRATSPEEQLRVDDALRALVPSLPGARLTLVGAPNRPPFPVSASRDLFAIAVRLGSELGLGELGGVEVGGGSDGNFTANVGTPTLDGLGPVGAGAHAEGEHVMVDSMAERAALVAALVSELVGRPESRPHLTPA